MWTLPAGKWNASFNLRTLLGGRLSLNRDKNATLRPPDELAPNSDPLAASWDTQPTRGLVLRGGFWAVLGFGLGQALRVVSNLVLANLIVPEAFGLMALVNVFLAGLQMFSDIGVGPCIIHNPHGDEKRFLNTAFSVQILRGILLFTLSCLAAYPFAVYYDESALMKLIPMAAFTVLISGFDSTSIWTLTRHIQQGKVTALGFLSDLVSVVVSIGWALYHPTVWALVVGVLARAAVQAATSHFLLPEKNRPDWEWSFLKDLYGYGKMIFLSTATFFLADRVESLVLGKFVTMAQLGVFSIARLLATFPSMAVMQVNNRVLFPTIAKSLRIDRNRAMRQYAKARFLLALLGVSMAAVVIFGGKWIVGSLLPEKYADAGWMIPILAVLGVFNVAGSTMVSLLMADARLGYAPIANLGRFSFIAVGLWGALNFYDFKAAIWIISLSPFLAYVVYMWGLRRHFREAFRTELLIGSALTLAIGFCLSVVM